MTPSELPEWYPELFREISAMRPPPRSIAEMLVFAVRWGERRGLERAKEVCLSAATDIEADVARELKGGGDGE